jgi:hypothetical protein
MSILARWLQLLQWLEGLLEIGDVLATPLGGISTVGLGLYGLLVLAGLDASTSASLAGSVVLGLACIMTRPDF